MPRARASCQRALPGNPRGPLCISTAGAALQAPPTTARSSSTAWLHDALEVALASALERRAQHGHASASQIGKRAGAVRSPLRPRSRRAWRGLVHAAPGSPREIRDAVVFALSVVARGIGAAGGGTKCLIGLGDAGDALHDSLLEDLRAAKDNLPLVDEMAIERSATSARAAISAARPRRAVVRTEGSRNRNRARALVARRGSAVSPIGQTRHGRLLARDHGVTVERGGPGRLTYEPGNTKRPGQRLWP